MVPLNWFLLSPCRICAAALPAAQGRLALCGSCRERLGLTAGGMRGQDPLPWWGAGDYGGALRQLLLELRRRPRPEVLAALMRGPLETLTADLGPEARPLLVPVPGWKRHANPLPGLLCRALEQQSRLRRRELLERTRPVLGQHHLGLRLRMANQVGAFRCRRPPGAGEARRHPLLLVDDILTSGATACSAALALNAGGWRVQGLLCLARTRLQPATPPNRAPAVP